jgi:FkbM family methyltransferase
MKTFDTTLIEIVNHLLQEHPQLAPAIGSLATARIESSQTERRYYGLNNLDEKLERWLNYDGGYFVELGANNGVDQSNTLYFEKYRNWRGVLVEPTPHNFLACKKSRSSASSVYCNACTSFDFPDKYVDIAYSNLMSTPLGLDSDLEDPMAHAALGRQFLAPTDENFVFGALATPLNTLLEQANAPATIDLLSLDVEGAELDVLRGVDHGRFRFKYLCIESRSKDRVDAYLSEVGYTLLEQLTVHDYLFADRTLL